MRGIPAASPASTAAARRRGGELGAATRELAGASWSDRRRARRWRWRWRWCAGTSPAVKLLADERAEATAKASAAHARETPMTCSSPNHLVVNIIGLVTALMWLHRSILCSVRFGHCSCRTCDPGNRLPTAIGRQGCPAERAQGWRSAVAIAWDVLVGAGRVARSSSSSTMTVSAADGAAAARATGWRRSA